MTGNCRNEKASQLNAQCTGRRTIPPPHPATSKDSSSKYLWSNCFSSLVLSTGDAVVPAFSELTCPGGNTDNKQVYEQIKSHITSESAVP